MAMAASWWALLAAAAVVAAAGCGEAGQISYGRIAELSGVDAQDLFLWFAVRSIRVDVPSSGVIYFDVGVVYKHFPLSFFEAPPPCVPTPLILLQPHQIRGDGSVVEDGAALQQ
ncbi:unnamed protein product [Triticum turgidum subsp. durum]|uniref:Uncharacterized protein n=1 Tax=Triticum turgidum subsp. durum TaxID=4567 RepID=A0A9R1S8B3_TRITD|nr:unnamed protein product [Triticum turgidum subsp. durum]